MLGFSSLARSALSINSKNCFRQLSSATEAFVSAQAKLKTLKEEPDNEVKLQLYALFKQASSGDVAGSRPGMMDFVGRAKYDAWAKYKGISQDEAQKKYAELVNSLAKEDAAAPASATVDGVAPVNGLDVSREGKVFKITLNRPTKFNALTLDMYRGIVAALESSNKDTSTSVTAITASGNYFCSGNDLTNFAKAASASKEEIRQMAEEAGVVLQQYVQAYIDHQKPLIGVINGPAVGIAVTVLPLFDFVLSTDKATFNTPFATLGQSPEGASTYTFPLLMGQLRATDVLLFGKKLTAHDALDYGLVSKVVPHDELPKAAEQVLANFSNLPPESLRVNKVLLRSIHKDGLTKATVDECRTIIGRWQSKECAQAIASFLTRSKKK